MPSIAPALRGGAIMASIALEVHHMAGSDKRLVPARPAAAAEASGYMPRIPWRYVLLGLFSVATVTGGFMLKERRKADAWRAQIVQVHEKELAEPARRYIEFRNKLEGLIVEAARKPPDSFADKRLRLSGLRAGKGLYLRLSAKDAGSPERIERGALAMEGDAIASCLGLAPASARGLWERGSFLMPEWLEDVRNDDSPARLRVTDTVLARHIKTDLPPVLSMLHADWFLLVLQQGANRRLEPVDAFLWDLRSGQQLLRGRVQAIGVLLPVRVQSKDAPYSPKLAGDQLEPATAADCSIAGQIKALAGADLPSVQNEPPVPPNPPPAAAPSVPGKPPASPAAPQAAPATPAAKP
jgi:hypothetical protein